MREDKEIYRRERWRRIIESNYKKWYKKIKGERIPGYLKKGWGESKWSRIAMFRLGNEMKKGWYWEEDENKKCRLYGEKLESWEHV